jgi:hypothetical protein
MRLLDPVSVQFGHLVVEGNIIHLYVSEDGEEIAVVKDHESLRLHHVLSDQLFPLLRSGP